ncbi:hypothetical protein BVRB_8g189120 [Beta vulgaris subsp. vulgaris]|nr:hypothetical protein BVRB_8g189120 [Beta vulgaris subsp. vulgaris]
MMKKLGLLAKSEGDYIWCHGPSGSPYLRLPRPLDALLPYGPLAKDFFLPDDSDIAPYLGSAVERGPVLPGRVEVEEEEEGFENRILDSSSDWSVWRVSVDDYLEELRDMQLETLAYMRSMSKMLSARYPDKYTPPDDALMTDLATRALARATRRDDHLTPRTSGPRESSHS